MKSYSYTENGLYLWKSLPALELSIQFNVKQTYSAADGSLKSTNNADLIRQHSSQFPCHLLTPNHHGWGIISGLISELNLPFPLERMHWKGAKQTEDQLEKLADLIQHILDEACWTESKYSKFGRKILGMEVNIEKRLILPRHEIEAMDRAREQEKRVSRLKNYVSLMLQRSAADFDWMDRERRQIVKKSATDKTKQQDDEKKLIQSLINRVLRELAEREVFPLAPASRSSIKALEKVILEGHDGSMESCSICHAEMAIGPKSFACLAHILITEIAS
ncbi:hypothetical protein F0562_003771 [Nyssa sinensis]|uniref:Uncharacterized protein n=1 Tax=Nyssa sinensis TaxID=561372 RepID=A0A5J5BWG6_9ASTE|nr:hypothetical protein F0562_003771 [Nyssa sinensis]